MIIRLASFILAASTASLVVLGAAAESVPDDRKVDLDRANALLAQGQYTDAIALYDDVIRMSTVIPTNVVEKDKSNYLSYYKRALSYLGLSRFHAAISDLDSVLAIQPDFSAALVQRGKLYAWQGEFQKAVTDLKKAHGQDEFVYPLGTR
jgi:DnaJ family protein C protein 3